MKGVTVTRGLLCLTAIAVLAAPGRLRKRPATSAWNVRLTCTFAPPDTVRSIQPFLEG
jgi:hypothetical protein